MTLPLLLRLILFACFFLVFFYKLFCYFVFSHLHMGFLDHVLLGPFRVLLFSFSHLDAAPVLCSSSLPFLTFYLGVIS